MRRPYKYMLVIVILMFSACRENFIHNLSELEANTIVMHLHTAGIDASKESQPDGNWSVSVSQSETVQAMHALNIKRLLRKSPPSREGSSSMLASREEHRLQFERALSTEIEYTLTAMPGVLDARVHLNLPERDPLLGEVLQAKESATASVLLIVEARATIIEAEIQRLLSGAAGIPLKNIVVLQSVMTSKDESEALSVPTFIEQSPRSSILQEFSSQIPIHSWIGVGITFGVFVYFVFILWKLRIRKRRRISSVQNALQQSEIPIGAVG